MNARTANKKFYELIDVEGEKLFSYATNTAFPKTYAALFMFCGKVTYLKDGVFDCLEAKNPYAALALFRCQIEHHLRFMHLWIRFLMETTDSPGSDYYSYCAASEAIDYTKAIRAAEGISGKDVAFDIKAILEKLHPELALASNAEIERESEKFKFRSLVRQVVKGIPGLANASDPLLTKLIPEYALLSSYVHGGPYADMVGVDEDWARYEDLSLMMAATTFVFTAGAVGREHRDVIRITSRLNDELSEFMRAGET